MSIEAEDWMRIKLPSEARKAMPRRVYDHGRNLIFKRLMPGVFLVVLFYYVFAFRPSVADFYCDGVHDLLTPRPQSSQVTGNAHAA
jgi:hypothetical protein